jgi:hypothetical protein
MAAAGSLWVASPATGEDRVSGTADLRPITADLRSKGLSASDWSSIRAAYDANRHAAFAVEDGYQARNPGQQWVTRFDGRGFETTPVDGGWSWGLELVSYDVASANAVAPAHSRCQTTVPIMNQCGGRIEYEWDASLTEWYVNDARGLEHGFTIHKRQNVETQKSQNVEKSKSQKVETSRTRDSLVRESVLAHLYRQGSCALRAEEQGKPSIPVAEATGNDRAPSGRDEPPLVRESSLARPLQLTLAVRGNLRPRVSGDGRDVAFVDSRGASVVNYSGLTVFDANGVTVPAWFEVGDFNSSLSIRQSQFVRIVVSDAEAVYPLTIDPIAQQAYLKASNTEANDRFGTSVAVSGDTVVVGARQEDSSATGVNSDQTDNSAADSGAAYVFVCSGGVWSQQAYLKASNTGAFDEFGHSVAVSGDTVVVGAFSEDSGATGVNGNGADNSAAQSGAAYVFARSGGVWSQQAYLKASNTDAGDQFGVSVAACGNTVVVGAPFEDSSATGVDGEETSNSAFNSGAAYVFVRGADGVWSQEAYLKASNTEAFDNFGFSVAASGDTVVVGARLESSNATGVDGNQADNSAAGSGATYVFVRDGGIWSQQAYLKASNTGADDLFGFLVAASGDTVVVGALQEDSNATGVDGNGADNSAFNSGAAYVFVRDASGLWSQQAYLKASNTGADDLFGFSVAVSGDTVVVGAAREDSSAMGVDGDQANNSAPNSGAAYVFVRSGAEWNQQAYLKASNRGVVDNFGHSVAASGDTVLVGAPLEDSSATGVDGNGADNSAEDSGAAYVFAIPPGSLELPLDIRPGACPNPLNRQSRGVLPVALVGSDTFDVSEVDLGTLQLARADGVGGSVAPHEGPPGPHSVVDDVATPFDGELCDCHDLAGDGFDDLVLHFRVDDLVAALELDDLAAGTDVELQLSGALLDGSPLTASDCIRLVPPAATTLDVSASAGGAFLDIAQGDGTLDAGGFDAFERSYVAGQTVTLTAPPSVAGRAFVRWVIDGVPWTAGQRTVTLTIAGATEARAIFESPVSPPGQKSLRQSLQVE